MDNRMKIKNNKKGNVVLDNFFWLVLAVLVILIVLFFVYQNTLIEWFRNLPGYEYNRTDRTIENLSKDLEIQMNYYKVAVISDGKYIRFCTNNNCNNPRDSNLYWYGNENGGIYVDKNWAIDKRIGDVTNNRIKIYPEVLNGGSLYLKLKNLLPSYEDLINLDNSLYISGIIYRDKKAEIKSGNRIFGTAFVRMPKDSNEFWDKLNAVDDADVLLVKLEYSFGDIKATEIQLERNGDKFNVFAYYVDESGKLQSHLLDCNKKGWVGKNLALANAGWTLKQTLDENCKW